MRNSKFQKITADSFLSFSAETLVLAAKIHDAAKAWRDRKLDKPIWLGAIMLLEKVPQNLRSVLGELNAATTRVDVALAKGDDYSPDEPPRGNKPGVPSGAIKKRQKPKAKGA